MNDLNYCSFIGRLGKPIDLRYTPDNKAIANFSIAVGESWKAKSGEKQEKTTWVNVVIFGKLAEIAGQYLNKGSKVFISGKLQVRKWQDSEGRDRYNTEIVIDQFNGSMQMLDSKSDNATQPSQTTPNRPRQAQTGSDNANQYPEQAKQPNEPKPAPQQTQKQTHDQVVDEMAQGFEDLSDQVPF